MDVDDQLAHKARLGDLGYKRLQAATSGCNWPHLATTGRESRQCCTRFDACHDPGGLIGSGLFGRGSSLTNCAKIATLEVVLAVIAASDFHQRCP
ncbi:MAG: hypothetical protein C1943_15465 [Halochromatium sp.]|nr:hypothetical protein [Halochromatium sp.]